MRDAVIIGQVAAGDGAQTHEIEMSIFDFEGIERPFDESDAALQGVLALKKFQAAAHAAVAVIGEDGGHVRMEKRLAASAAPPAPA